MVLLLSLMDHGLTAAVTSPIKRCHFFCSNVHWVDEVRLVAVFTEDVLPIFVLPPSSKTLLKWSLGT